MTNEIPLSRRFQKITKDADADETESFRVLAGVSKDKNWTDLHQAYRTVVLADAGAGKTFEMERQARQLHGEGRPAFFLRIENITTDFTGSFEVGTSKNFSQWLLSQEDAWFFLDSVDEARLDEPRAFENAITFFASAIHDAMHRAHIYISSRPYAWRAKLDRDMLERHLPSPKKQHQIPSADPSGDVGSSPPNALQTESSDSKDEYDLSVHWLCPLNRTDIRFYAGHRDITNLDGMLSAIERADLWSMAERPFDLDDLIDSWKAGETFSNRLEILRSGIRRRLDEIHPDRGERQPLRSDQALQGARQLAAAVVLSNQPGIKVPEGQFNSIGLNAEEVLEGWSLSDIKALLSRSLFNEAIYGAVRIRHREIRDLLAAEWFDELLRAGASRHKIENLIFTTQYGEQVVRPRMRPILPWLILFDDSIRKKALTLHPEIAVEGGDVSGLPKQERKRILCDMVDQIARKEDDRNGCDNAAIARIAQTDLEDDAKALIAQHAENDDAIFFLGRFVWQGRLAACLPRLAEIACDSSRGIYARLVSVRAVASVGSKLQKNQLWQNLIDLSEPFQRKLLVELISDSAPEDISFDLLIQTLAVLAPHEKYETTGLSQALHDFIGRFSFGTAPNGADGLLRLATSLNELLDHEPHIERGECHVSISNRWLMPIALQIAKTLIQARSRRSFESAIMAILLKAPAVRLWSDTENNVHESQLSQVVADWPEFNDALFWASIDEKRAALDRKSGEGLTDDWPVTWQGHYWQLGILAFTRVIQWISSKENLDDRLVALSRAFRIYSNDGKSEPRLAQLKQSVAENTILLDRLDRLMNPQISVQNQKWQREETQRKRNQHNKKLKDVAARAAYVTELKADFGRVRNISHFKSGKMSNDQFWLLRILDGEGLQQSRTRGADWQTLIPEFGEDVARAYRDAALACWRAYRPALRSEGADTSSTPYAQNFALAGLTIEAKESPNFPHHLVAADVTHALRYFACELNGFPSWFEPLYKAYPDQAFALVWKELVWELEATKEDAPFHYVLHDFVYHAPWLHKLLASPLLDWIISNSVSHADSLRYVLHILKAGEIARDILAALAQTKLLQPCPAWQDATWYALWIDADPDEAIPALEQEIEYIVGSAETSLFAQKFIVALMGSRRSAVSVCGAFKSAEYLKTLYALMHLYIRADEDIERAGKGVYSPGLRDHAQDARNSLLNILCEIPGKSSYAALQQLASSHPDPDSRQWMKRLAYNRAVADADLPEWLAKNVVEFKRDCEVTPRSHRALYDLGVFRLTDFKNWLELGNDSLASTYRRVPNENEMRNIVANWLRQHASNKYSCAQEHELANGQRLDICLLNHVINVPVPIELKLLDKSWTGAKLCERLRNQLAGDYLREHHAGCGIMLLIWQGSKKAKHWEIEGERVGVSGLGKAMQEYWQSISVGYPKVEAIEVIVIDLTVRAEKSTT